MRPSRFRTSSFDFSKILTCFEMAAKDILKHVKILEKSKLLVRKREGRIHFCTLDATALKTAEECIHFYTQFWNHRLDLLAEQLEESYAKRKKRN